MTKQQEVADAKARLVAALSNSTNLNDLWFEAAGESTKAQEWAGRALAAAIAAIKATD